MLGNSVVNIGTTLVYADLGTTTGAPVGFPPGVVLGQIRANDAEAQAADAEAERIYSALGALAPTANLTGQQLGRGFGRTPEAVNGTVLTRGVYRFDGDARLSGQLRLDGAGSRDAVFVFQINGDLIIDEGSVISVQNGAQPRNVFFRVTGNIIIGDRGIPGTSSALKGNVFVNNNIALSNGTTHEGRLFSLNGLISLNNNTIFLPLISETDVAITKTVDRPVAAIGDTVTYTITVRNQGPDDATGVRVVETLPSQLAFVDFSPSTIPATFAGNTITFSLGSVPLGQSVVITLRARVLAAGNNIINRVQVTANEPDPDEDDNTAEVPINVPNTVTDLQVVKTVNRTRANVGDALVYTVTVRNNGPNNATGVVVQDVLPSSQVNFTSPATTSTGTYNFNTGIWVVGNLAAGQTATLTITGTITSTGTIVNTAIVRGNESDSQPTNNTSTVVTVVGQNPNNPGPFADLQVTKSVDKTRAAIGQTITYTVEAFNAGPDNATGVVVRDPLPTAFATFGEADESVGVYNATTGVWTIGNLAAGARATLTVTGTITANGIIVNTAVISGNEIDERPENNTATVVTVVTDGGGGNPDPNAATDIQVVKSVDKTRARVGQTLTYTVVVRNNGPNNATGVLVVDVLPTAQLNITTAPAVTNGTYNDITGVWNVGNLAAGASATFTVTGTITATGTIVNTATGRSNEADPQPQNNTSTVITVVEDTQNPGVLADLQVVKTVNRTRANVGDALVYTVTARNNGPANATGVVVVDVLPTGQLTFVGNPTVTAGTYNTGTGRWNIGNLAAGQSVTFTVTGIINATGTIVNTATIGGNEADQQPDNNTSTVITVVGPGTEVPGDLADLQVVKTVDKTRAAIGQTITYKVTARNLGPSTATNVTVRDVLPTALANFGTATTTTGAYDVASGIWTIGSLTAGQSVELTVTGTITGNGTIVNTAVISGDQTDERPENNTSTVITVVTDGGGGDPDPNASTDLQVVKTVDKTRAQVGNQLTYTVTVRNNGPNNATGVLVVDNLPVRQVTFATAPTVSAGTYNTNTGVWNVGNLVAGQTATLTVTGTITTAGTIVNTAVVRGNEADPQPQNNTSTVITIVDNGPATGMLADLEVTKTVDKSRAVVGQTLVYVITARNNGPANATGVNVRDILPINQLNLNGQPNVSTGSYNSATGIWNIGNLAANETAVMTVSGTITATGTIVNTATIGGNEADPRPENNTSTVVTVVGPGTEVPTNLTDLQIVKSVDKARASAGQTLTYTLVARNNGPSAATGVTVTDILPSGQVTFATAPLITGGGTYNAATGIWNIGNLAVGQSVVLRVTGTITATTGTIINTAVIRGAQTDERPENNTSTVITVITPGGEEDPDPITATDLQVVKTVNRTTANVGETLVYTITARNNGPNSATGVLVVDVLPRGQVNFTGAPTLTGGTYNDATGVWSIGNLAVGQSVTMTVTGTITATGTIVNTAVVRGNQADLQPQNNTSTVITVVGAGVGAANLSITKTVNRSEVTLGDQVVFTLSARNAGPATATNVTVQDVLPAGFTFVSASPDGAYANNTWTIGTLAAGQTTELTITAATNRVGTWTNVAVITGSEEDPDDDDNTDEVDVCVRPTAPSTANQAVCRGTNAVFNVTAIAGVTNFEVTGLPTGVTRVQGGGNIITLQVAADATPGTYNLTFVALNSSTNCANSLPSTFTLTISAAPNTPVIQGGPALCAGTVYTYSVANVEAGVTYAWTTTGTGWSIQGPANGTQVQVVAGTTAGGVTVTATRAGACAPVSASTAPVTPGSTPAAPVILDNTGACTGLEFAIQNPVAGVTYTWTAPAGFNFAGGAITATGTSVTLTSGAPNNTGTLRVVATNTGNSCGSAEASIQIDAADADTQISIPNVFTPNGDGKNDAWVIRNLEKYPDNDVFIYNRWGNEVYRARGYGLPGGPLWRADGLEEATYFYVLRVRGCGGEEQTFRGPVQVVR